MIGLIWTLLDGKMVEAAGITQIHKSLNCRRYFQGVQKLPSKLPSKVLALVGWERI